MKIYTKSGDDGTTGTLGQGRRSKSDLLFTILGELDELNAAIGMGVHEIIEVESGRVQSFLLELGSEIASLSKDERYICQSIDQEVDWLETDIDRMESELPALTNFLLPGGVREAANFHFARTICRRAERSLVVLLESEPSLRTEGVKYLNRLSDWLFVVARSVNDYEGVGDSTWVKKND